MHLYIIYIMTKKLFDIATHNFFSPEYENTHTKAFISNPADKPNNKLFIKPNILDEFKLNNSKQKNNTIYKTYHKIDTITDSQGLNRAYDNGDYYIHGNTLYIAGTDITNFQDIKDDITKVPFWGDLKESARYKTVEPVLKNNPQITTLVGHSLGGSVSLELQKQYPNLKTRTYGAPVWDPLGRDNLNRSGTGEKVDRYRNLTDPISFFDASAQGSVMMNPFSSKSLTHGFSNIGDKFTSSEDRTFQLPVYPTDKESIVLTDADETLYDPNKLDNEYTILTE